MDDGLSSDLTLATRRRARPLRQLRLVIGVAALINSLFATRFWPQLDAIVVHLSLVWLLAMAALALGGLVGFLFGLPRSTAIHVAAGSPTAPGQVPLAFGAYLDYGDNTNLEQASDWLTKLLIGAGLAQVANLPGIVGSLVSEVTPALGGGAEARLFAGTALVSFTALGFLYAYLWTRLNMPGALAEGRRTQRLTEQSARDDWANDLLEQQLDAARTAVAAEELSRSLTEASESVRSRARRRAVQVRRYEHEGALAAHSERLRSRRLAHMERTILLFQTLVDLPAPSPEIEMYLQAQLAYALKDAHNPGAVQLGDAVTHLTEAIRIAARLGFDQRPLFHWNRAASRAALDELDVSLVLTDLDVVAASGEPLVDDDGHLRDWLDRHGAEPAVVAWKAGNEEFLRSAVQPRSGQGRRRT